MIALFTLLQLYWYIQFTMSGYLTTPTFEGWWKCHKCDREVDSSAWKHDCPDCPHHKCDECTDIETPGSQAPIANDSVNYGYDSYEYPEVLPTGSSSWEAHHHSSSSHGRSRRSKPKRQNMSIYESQQSTERQRTHRRGLHNETCYANSDEFHSYTKFPAGDMFYCCKCNEEFCGSSSCPCGHSKCSSCSAAN